MPRFFIDHPVFAWVVAILLSLSGVIAIMGLGVESYPTIAPPQVTVSASYPGADAETAERSVTQVIEQQLTGIDNLLYFSSTSSARGGVSVTLTFETGTDADIAQVQVQNKVALATPRLPSEVVQQGVVVAKANAGFLMVVSLRSPDGSTDSDALNDIVGSRLVDQVARIPGVGNTQQFGSEYAMNIWLNPDRLRGYGLAASDVLSAIRGQNVQFAAGAVGAAPAARGQGFTATVSAEGRFSSPEQFRDVVLRADSDGTTVRLSDVARVEFGGQSHGFDVQFNGTPAAGFAVQLLPGANALSVAEAVRERMDELQPSFPRGVEWFTPFDSSTFVEISIRAVVQTLFEALLLVFLVMLVFLQNFRATMIPFLVIPVALLGTFLGLSLIGFTINQLTLFAMILAIGIVVDDAIVVIENVERIMTEEGLAPREATRKAMGQITGAIIATSVVLAAVFIPSALQGGASGEIFKQFAVTIAIATGISTFLALGFTPALCATLLKSEDTGKRRNVLARTFNKYYDKVNRTYVGHISGAVRHAPRWMILFAVLAVLTGFLFMRMPGSFLPEEDQGYALAIVQLPPGATLERTTAVFEQVREQLEQLPAFDSIMQVAGFSFVGQGENVGMGFIRLRTWDEREDTAPEFIAQANGALYGIKEAQIFVINLPTVQGLGQFGGFDMWLQDRAGVGREGLTQARNQLMGAAAQNAAVTGVRPNSLENAPQLQLNLDRLQARAMGVSVNQVYSTIQLMLAPVYVNDFFYQGRIKRVIMQGDAPYRMGPESLSRFYLPASASAADGRGGGTDAMIPLTTVVDTEWVVNPPALSRYNGFPAVNIVGSQAPGRSSGEAMDAMQGIVDTELPAGFGSDWAGMSYQEVLSGNTATLLLALSIVVAFLCLAALYESWSVPLAVLLVVPVGLLGAIAFSMLRGLPNDLFFKVGLITVVGLAAKNAILIVEFAVSQQREGKTLRDAVVEACRLRFRPILMTSFAFVMGVFPMAISTGAGANARHAIGTGVIGGMLFATFIGLLLIPVFFVVVRRMLGNKLDEPSAEYLAHEREGSAAT